MASQFDNRNDILTRYNYERERRRRASQAQPTPQIMSAHDPVVNPNANINPFQDNFTPNTNTVSMQQIAGQVAPRIEQPLLERIGRGAANIPIGMAAMAEQATSDPAGFAKGTGEYLATWARRLNPNPLSSDALQARAEWGQQFATDPVGSTLDAAGVAGTALGLPALGGKMNALRNRAASRVPEIIRKAVEPKVVPEVVQKPIVPEPPIQETVPIQQPSQVPEIIRQAVDPSTPPVEKAALGNKLGEGWVMRPIEYRGGVASVFETPMGLIERVKSKSKAAGLGGDRWKASFENTEYLAKTPDEASQWLKQQRAGKISTEQPTAVQDAKVAAIEARINKRGFMDVQDAADLMHEKKMAQYRDIERQQAEVRKLLDEAKSDDLTIPNMRVPSGYIEAKRQVGGKYKLFYRGTRNEVFQGQEFSSASEARNFYKAMQAKDVEMNQRPPADSRAGKTSTEPTATPDAAVRPAHPATAEAVVKKAGETKTPISGAIEIKDELSTTKIDHKQFKSEINDRLDKMISDAPTLEEKGVRTKLNDLGGHPNNSSNIANARDLTQYGINRVEIEIPGDGTFRIWNTKEHLAELKKLANRAKLPGEDEALRKWAPYNQGLSDQLARNAVKNAKASKPPTELHAGVNRKQGGESVELGALGTPSALSGAMKSVGKVAEKTVIPIQYIAKKIDGFMEKRGIANPLGTPEIVLKDTGIVEAFREAAGKEHAFVAEQSARLKDILGDRIKNEKYLAEMFRHLDNPEAILNPTEKALRGWFDDMLNTVNEFRVKRGEEPINYTEGYIPHIFKKVKELLDADHSIALPRKAQNRFANTRVGAEGYEKDLILALELYTKATARDMYVNDALHASIPAIEAMSKNGSKILRREVITTPDGASKTVNFYNLNNADMWSKRGYAEAFVRAQLGLPTQGQRFFKQLGINPRTSQRVSNMATGLVYRNLLGMAIDTGIKNLSQITHTIAENGMAPTMRGIGKFLTPEGIKTARAEHLLKEFDAFLLAEDMPAATRAKIFKQFDENVINGAMRFSEFVNRGIAYHTALDDAIKAGKSIADAHEIALKAVRGTQFEYNKLGTSPFMRGPLTRPAAQFMTFPVKTSEMLYRWANEGQTGRGKLLRYFATVGGLVYAGKEVGVELGNIFFDPTKTVDKDSKGGIALPLSGNKVKLDLSRLGTTGFAPQGAVPAVTKPYKYINDLIEKDRTAGQRVGQAAREFLPGGRFVGKAVDVATGSEYRDERGRLIRKDTPKDAFLKLFGGRSSNQESMNNKKTDIHDIEQEYYETRRKIIDTQLNGDIEEAKRMIADFSEKYPYLGSRLRKSLRQGRKDEKRKRQMSSDERFMDNSIRQQIERNL